MFARKHSESGQVTVLAVILVMVLVLVAGTVADLYRIQEIRSFAYRAAEAAALAGVSQGRDYGSVISTGQMRVDPTTAYVVAEETLLSALALHNLTATYDIRVLEYGGTVPGFPPVSRADLWGAGDWVSDRPAVGVYLEVPVQTMLLGWVWGEEVRVHVFAAAGVGKE
jgi:hypothetical protein